jgi:hypothetical protein
MDLIVVPMDCFIVLGTLSCSDDDYLSVFTDVSEIAAMEEVKERRNKKSKEKRKLNGSLHLDAAGASPTSCIGGSSNSRSSSGP